VSSGSTLRAVSTTQTERPRSVVDCRCRCEDCVFILTNIWDAPVSMMYRNGNVLWMTLGTTPLQGYVPKKTKMINSWHWVHDRPDLTDLYLKTALRYEWWCRTSPSWTASRAGLGSYRPARVGRPITKGRSTTLLPTVMNRIVSQCERELIEAFVLHYRERRRHSAT
jgi:hypothetical protein